VILTQLPDLPPRPETPRNASFRREFYSRWGKENSIVCGSAQRAEYAKFRQSLSIKSVRAGREHYFVDGRRLTVTDESWLVLNEGREYSSVLEGSQNAFSFCLFFRPGMAEEINGARALRLAQALDYGRDLDMRKAEFAENLRPHDESVSPVLSLIRRQVALGADDAGWCEEQFNFLLGRLMRRERDAARLADRVDSARSATRKELIRRIGRATDFMHSNLQRELSLSDIASAAHLSNFHFLRVFRQVHGVTPMMYLRAQRTRRALALLDSTQLRVSEVAQLVGLTRLSLWRHVRSARGEAPRHMHRRRDASCTA
jgi:AraC-like DNA-binding protein